MLKPGDRPEANSADVVVTAEDAAATARLDDQKKQLEIAKLQQEITNLRDSRRWIWTSVRGVKLTEWVTALAAVVLVMAGWYSGLFSATRERLETDKNRLAIEKVELERQNEERRVELEAKRRELAEVRTRLMPFEQEEEGLEKLRESDKDGLRITFAASPNFDGVKVSFTHKNLVWNDTFSGPASPDNTVRLQAITKAVASANSFRKLHGIRVREIVITREDAELLTAHDNLEVLMLECASVDQRVVGGLRPTKKLQKLSLPGNRLYAFDGVSPMNTVMDLDLRDNPIGDEGISSVLVAFPNLQTICLSGTSVSDASIQHLVKLRGLAYVDVRKTRVTGQGLIKLLDCPLMHILRADNRVLTETVRSALKNKSPELHIYGDDFDGDQPFANW